MRDEIRASIDDGWSVRQLSSREKRAHTQTNQREKNRAKLLQLKTTDESQYEAKLVEKRKRESLQPALRRQKQKVKSV